MWRTHVFRYRDTPIDENQFVEELCSEFNADDEKCTTRLAESMRCLITIIDINEDGRISLDEYRKMHKIFGLEDEELLMAIYDMCREGDDMPFDVVMETWTEFVTGNDAQNTGKLTAYMMTRA